MKYIAVLEDETRREEVMRPILGGYPGYEVRFFNNAPDMVDWLAFHLPETALICLDHDLGPNHVRDGKVFNPGTGRHVVDFLAGHPPTCPVIVHTTNGYASPGMMFALEYAGWTGIRVVPYNEIEWVNYTWAAAVESVLGGVVGE